MNDIDSRLANERAILNTFFIYSIKVYFALQERQLTILTVVVFIPVTLNIFTTDIYHRYIQHNPGVCPV